MDDQMIVKTSSNYNLFRELLDKMPKIIVVADNPEEQPVADQLSKRSIKQREIYTKLTDENFKLKSELIRSNVDLAEFRWKEASKINEETKN